MNTQLPLPKERLAEIAADGFVAHGEIKALARALLAAYEQEPVFFVEIEGDDWINAGRIEGKDRPDLGLLPDGINNLYAQPAPSIPSAVPDFKKLAAELVENLVDCDSADDSAILQYTKWAEKTCRAAMLQAEPSGWIPVSERLPEPNKYVLVSNGVWVGQGAYNDSEHLEDDEHWQDEHHEFINLLHHPVTHWQSLPAAPKGV